MVKSEESLGYGTCQKELVSQYPKATSRLLPPCKQTPNELTSQGPADEPSEETADFEAVQLDDIGTRSSEPCEWSLGDTRSAWESPSSMVRGFQYGKQRNGQAQTARHVATATCGEKENTDRDK